jgi:drug/metabolite transporter (DMT)-like permease
MKPLSAAGFAVRLLACSLLWASGFLFMKLAGSASPLVIAAARAGIAAVVLATWFMLRGESPLPRRDERTAWLVLGTLNGWLPNWLTAYALTQIAAAQSAMIQASGPLMVAALAHFAFSDERLTGRRIAGLLVGFAGMAVLIGPAALSGGAGLIGILAMVAVSLSYAVGNIYARTVRELHPSRLALGQQTVSGIVAVALAAVLVGSAAWTQIGAAAPALLALGVLATAVPITIFMGLIRSAGPTRAAMIGYLMPVWATLLAVIFLGESVGLREIAGAATVLAGVFVVSTAPRAVQPAPSRPRSTR